MLDDISKQLVLSHIELYCKYHNLKFRKTKKYSIAECPYCHEESANVIPNTHKLSCWKCDRKFTLEDVVRDNNPDISEDGIYDYLIETLKLDINTTKDLKDLDDLLKYYEAHGFDMLPICTKTKIPSEKQWTSDKIIHKDRKEWIQWINSGLNISVKPGYKSNITILDMDVLSKEEKCILRQNKTDAKKHKIDLSLRNKEYIETMEKKREEGLNKLKTKFKDIMGTPLIQKTLGGEHWIYKYEASLPKTYVAIDGIHIDIENDGGQVLVQPSKIYEEPEERYFMGLGEIPKISKEFLKVIIDQLPASHPKTTHSEELEIAIKDDSLKIDPTKFALKNNDLEGCCNLEVTKLGGKFRQGLSPKQTEFALKVFNKHVLKDPLDSTSINNICSQLEKYYYADVDELEDKILDYMKAVTISTKAEVELSVQGQFTKGDAKKRIVQVMQKLLEEGRLKKISKNEYQYVKKIKWVDTLFDLHKPLQCKIPYVGDLCNFNIGDHVVIGSQTGHGKTILAMNMIDRIVKQGIKPYYLGREGGSRWVEDAWSLGLTEGDFFHPEAEEFFAFNELELNDNSIVIYDWYKPNQYKDTANDFDELDKKLKKHKSFAIVFVQLRDNNTHFAKDQILQFATFGGKYIYDEDEDGNRGEFTRFEIDKNRSPKNNQMAYKPISCRYDFKSKKVETIEEYQRKLENK